ncbi:MAG: AzlD domain-containing protein [Acidithiobacillus sp.]|jgi:branched-subunit amino acid transport protein AzlD|nr:AzlD domain-containing protein [Acidithiobacillus sp.]
MANPLWLIIAAAIGTFLQRFIPFLIAHKARKRRNRNSWWETFLEGIGPAAIASLLIISLSPELGIQSSAQITAVLTALCVVFLAKKLMGGVAIATLLGATVYGLISWAYGSL